MRADRPSHDSFERHFRFNRAALGTVAGAAAGAWGYAIFHSLLAAAPLALVVGVLVARLPQFIGDRMAAIFHPSGHTTPAPDQHSRAAALAARGDVESALSAYAAASAADPDDPAALFAGARLLRDQLGDPAAALTWFRRAERARRLTPGEDVLLVREVAELCEHQLRDPLRAAPELARLARSRPGTPEGEWAARELQRIRAVALAAGSVAGGAQDE